ncbi:MAG: 4-hydroxythreonine-4-phosphate dehydrogenase PdxA [Candidatus Omnitrophica bacterium]|nr:4-hydroxythreonine-4-phosphate dehydrogenase PdxA [Candidatus Omnitrophota bacterium]
MNKRISVGVTMGDPSGIGPEVIIKAIKSLKGKFPVNFVIIGDYFTLDKCSKEFNGNFFSAGNVSLINLANVERKNFKFGKITPACGRASLEYIDKSVELLKHGKIQALVTAPVSKEAINASGKKFSGHTEYLASNFNAKDFMMMLLSGELKVIPLTRHVRLRDVPGMLNRALVYNGIKAAAGYLRKYFSIYYPRIAVCSLNPHGGEGGFIGKEEKETIIPAIEKAKGAVKAELWGPLSADGLFAHAPADKFDCIIGMYHDQVLVPVKMYKEKSVVNLTLGLPFIRTSCGHGTAFDIAGKNVALACSMIEAIKLAYKLSINT